MLLRIFGPCLVACVFLTNCNGCLEKLAPGKVSMGAARLTVRNAGAILKALDADTTCGFAAPQVKRAILIQGQPGDEGAITFEVTNCKLNFEKKTVISKDCEGVETSVQGTVTVSGKKRVIGTVSGNTDIPIFPSVADSVHFDVDATFDGPFAVESSASKAKMIINKGRLQFALEPKLALSTKNDACSVPTGDVTFPSIAWTQGLATISDESRTFDVTIDSSQFSAQAGKWDKRTNDFKGQLSVWGSNQTLPVAGEEAGLDPEYSEAGYLKAIACSPDLATPVTYVCPSRTERLAHGGARLSIVQLAAITSMMEANTRCGFSSPAVLNSAVVNGTIGREGSARFVLPAPCVLDFPQDTDLAADCKGKKQYVRGRASVTGTKVLTGVLSGDTTQPVVPNTRSPVVFDLEVTLDNFIVSERGAEASMKTVSGRLAGRIKPRVAVDTRTGICAYPTSIAEISNVTITNAEAEIINEGFAFKARFDNANLEAQSGETSDKSNSLTGTVTTNGIPISIPPLGRPPLLDPGFESKAFLESFSCAPGFKLAEDDAACSVEKALGTNIGRLLLLIAGNTAGQVNSNVTCGFEKFSIKTNPDTVTGSAGEMGQIQWNVNGCQIGQAAPQSLGVDCAGNSTHLQGTTTVTVRRTITGERERVGGVFDGIIPRSRTAVTFDLSNTVPNEFSVYGIPRGETTPFAKLTITGGLMAGRVVPILGERASSLGKFDIATPVSTFTRIQLSNSRATLEVSGKTFRMTIVAAEVSGQSGTFRGVSNTLSGLVTLNSGQTLNIPAGTILDPSFNQASFDAAYACTPDLREVIPQN